MKDGIWLGWKDEAPGCQMIRDEGFPCGPGYKGQKRKCERSLGGKYCQENGKDVKEDVLYRTTKCDMGKCPGGSLKLFCLKLSIIFRSPT